MPPHAWRLASSILALMLLLSVGGIAAAQEATFGAVQGVVAKQAAGSTQWSPCKVGTALRPGDRASTAKRSAAQIDFPDGSYVRLSELTDLVLRAGIKVNLQVSRGRIYGRFAKGSGATIGGRSAVAAVKGTVIEFLANEKAESVRCHEGEVLLAQAGPLTRTGTADGGTVDALVDDALQVDPDGYWNGGTLTITAGTNAGEQRTVLAFAGGTGTVTVDAPFPAPIDGTSQYILSLAPPEEVVKLGPGQEASTKLGEAPGNPFPTAPEAFAGGEENPFFRDVRPGDTGGFAGTPGEQNFRDDTTTIGDVIDQTVGGQGQTGSLHVIIRSLDGHRRGAAVASAPPRTGPGVRLQGPPVSGHENPLDALAAPLFATAPLALFGSSALEAVPPEELPGRQQEWIVNGKVGVELFGFWGEGGGSSGGVRVRPTGVMKGLYFELGGCARSVFGGDELTDLTAAYVTARGDWGSLRVGRQRFFVGPVINSNIGTLLDFRTADAVRWTSSKHNNTTFDVAYLLDTTPSQGDPDLAGLYGRVTMQNDDGVFGLNLRTVQGDLGHFAGSVDAAIPVVRRRLDLYGELGEDPFGNLIYTVGTYFPKLYQDHDVDLFLEYAHRDGIPNLMSARVYKTFSDKWIGVMQIQHSEDRGIKIGAGAFYRFDIR